MSASLVGSEMCIRDRSHSESWAARTLFHARTQTPAIAIGRRREVLGTVSYTHLTLPTICSV
eukprot:14576771-Alexandrium_andersonii.AAC.1